jgi:uncharacterized protein
MIFIASFLNIARPAFSQDLPCPPSEGYVADTVGLLNQETLQYVNNLIAKLDKLTTAQLAVVTIDSTTPETIEQYAILLFNDWEIGQADKDNGVLLLIAIKDRRLRIEIGYGLEDALTNDEAKYIIDEIIVPHFKEDNYIIGTVNGIEAIIDEILESYGYSFDEIEEPRPDMPEGRNTEDIFYSGNCDI